MRFFRTIKFRINLGYLMLLAVAVLFFSIMSYLLLEQRVSLMNLDAAKFTVLKAPIIPAADSESPPETSPADLAYEFESGYVISREQLQEIKSQDSSPQGIIAPEGVITFDQKAFISPDMTGEQQVWIYSRPLASEPGYYELLVAIQSKAPLLAMLGAYKQVLYIAIPVTLLFAGLLGYYLIRRLLHPLGLITRAYREMQEKDLDRKIEIQSDDELGELSAALNQTFERLHKSLEREHQFTSDTSHELRAPLAIVQGEATLALDQSRNEEEYRRHLESISKQVSHMSSVVGKLLFLAWSGKDKEPLCLEEIDLKEALEDIAAATGPFREEKKLGLDLDLQEGVMVRGDEAKLKELFLNLMDNAIKYTPAGGRISLSLAKQDDTARITIKDTGAGIPTEHLPRIFERFYRVNRTGPEKGSGLGLAICRRIVEMHRGRIEVETREGEGSVFTVTLPLKTAH